MGTPKFEDADSQYRRLERQKSLVAFIQKSPLAKALAAGELELVRDRHLPRDVQL